MVREISATSNEISAFATLLADIDDEHIRGTVVTMSTQLRALTWDQV